MASLTEAIARPWRYSEAGAACGVSASTLSRFLSGRGIDSDTLDRVYEFVLTRLPEVPR